MTTKTVFAIFVNHRQGGFKLRSGSNNFVQTFETSEAASEEITRRGWVNSTSVVPGVRTAYVIETETRFL
jgi:hypothetical protein